MSSKQVKDRIKTYLKSVWTDTKIVYVDNVYVDQPDDEDWLTVQFQAAFMSNEALGNNCWRETGAINVSLVGISGEGTDALDGYFETLLPLIMGQDIDGIVVDSMTTPAWATSESHEETMGGNAYRYMFSIQYHFDRYNA